MLVVHRAERADALADALSQLLAAPLEDPFAAEVVAVPTRGMERWLTQRMSAVLGATAGASDGVCANVEFPFPHRLVTEAIAAASGVDAASEPWLPERAVLRVEVRTEIRNGEYRYGRGVERIGEDNPRSEVPPPEKQSPRDPGFHPPDEIRGHLTTTSLCRFVLPGR